MQVSAWCPHSNPILLVFPHPSSNNSSRRTILHSRDSLGYNSTIRNRAEAIFEWHACRVLLDAGRRIGTHGEEREKFVEKAMSSIRLDGFSGRNT
jgi:hypothetical protein